LENLLWKQNINKKLYPHLDKDIEVDYLIIGGGITGISTAYFLGNIKEQVAIIDEGEFAHGVTMRSTAKLTYLQEDLYSKIIKAHGENKAYEYIKSQKDAINLVINNIKEHNINCNLEKTTSYLFTCDEKNINKLEKEKTNYQGLNLKKDDFPLILNNLKALDAFFKEDTYVFHPIKYLTKLLEILEKRNILLFEKTKAIKIIKEKDQYLVLTNHKTIKSKKIVIACHYPFFFFPNFIPFHTHLEKSAITVIDSKFENIQGINIDKTTHSFRYHKDKDKSYLIYLSDSHKLGNQLDNEQIKENILNKSNNIANKDKLFFWTNYDIITSDYLPIIGPLHKNDENMLIATGYNTWGMTNGTLAGKMLSCYLLEKEVPYKNLFAPFRKLSIYKTVNILMDNLHNSKSFILSKIKKVHSFYPKQVLITTIDEQKCGIYIDEKKQKHIVKLTCPHMMCSLTFNKEEKTWDCPCHGSRFDIDGNVIKGPSSYSISFK